MASSDFTTEAQVTALANKVNTQIGARQPGSAKLTQVTTVATSANSGKVLGIDASGNVVATAPTGGTASTTDFAALITN